MTTEENRKRIEEGLQAKLVLKAERKATLKRETTALQKVECGIMLQPMSEKASPLSACGF